MDVFEQDTTPFLEKVTNIAPGVIYIFNQKTQSNEYSNRSLGETLGYSAAEVKELGAGLIPNLCHPDDLPGVLAHFERLPLLESSEIARVTYRMRHKDGQWVWLLSHDTIFERAEDGSVLRHVGIASDITAQKLAEERAIAEKQRATAINEELRAFSYSMSHDMKSPSNTLNLLLTELLDSHGDTLDPDAISLLDMSLETVNRMRVLVDDVLNYTQVIDREIKFEPVDLNTLLGDIFNDLRALKETAHASLSATDLPVVMADAMQLRILLQNLVENAIKFHAPGVPPEVAISVAVKPEINKCWITVTDKGIGIEPAKHDQIFTIFKKLNGTMDYQGTGLGLAICRRIANNHHSEITVVSEQGEGAAFTFGLETS